MTMAADQFDDTPSPTDLQQFVYLANVVELLETAKRDLERDNQEAVKASLATASIILQSETTIHARGRPLPWKAHVVNGATVRRRWPWHT